MLKSLQSSKKRFGARLRTQQKGVVMLAPMFWFLLVAVAVSVAALVLMVPNPKNKKAYRAAPTCGWFLIAAAVLSPLYYEFPNPTFSNVVTFENGVATYHPYGTFTLGREFSVFPCETRVESAISFLTENPKVRRVSYEVSAHVADLKKFYANADRRKRWGAGSSFDTTLNAEMLERGAEFGTTHGEIGRVVLSALYEFNDEHARDLGRFFNPLDPDQQTEFKRLLGGFINTRLKGDGIAIEVKRFTLE
ncbi:MAG: hypothetical protein A2122_00855 [Candidatus Liptonbacteria bacterium GWB1_49_6]|uniref:Uncharacterized protein n=1 Tax=Candidatus Liptonbacteria bacterium GWB1_49_6 TaxID=1798644 RepID=A0A1G2C7Y9_9BACT|nr:MAG: hypothetical protein A2122_00855 [Candidatus Liptonbacteria bacterium GWB1_49_6]